MLTTVLSYKLAYKMWNNYMDKVDNWTYKMEYIIVLMVLFTTSVFGQDRNFEQSSTFLDGNLLQEASYAMNNDDSICSQTQKESDPWWRVQLEQEVQITQITTKLNRRKVDLKAQLQGAEFRVGSCTTNNGLSNSNTLCGTVTRGQATSLPDIRISCPDGTYGQYLFINLPGDNKTITLCEVELTTNEVPADQKSMVSFSSPSYEVVESAGSVDVEVTRSGRTLSCLSVELSTSPGTASEGSDFVPIKEVLQFDPGEETKVVSITMISDTTDEGAESFTVNLSDVKGGEFGTDQVATVDILESLPTTTVLTTAPNIPTTSVALTTPVPTSTPAIPTTTPAATTTTPVAPTTAPAVPTTTPAAITTTPVAPTTAPPVPTTTPAAITTTPVAPTTTPSLPTTTPTLPTTTPVVPTSTPTVPTTTPAVPTTSPVAPTTTPVIPTTTPVATTTLGMPTTTPNLPTTTPTIPTITPNIQTTTPNIPTTTPTIPTTTPNVPTTTPNIPTTTPTIPTTTPNIPTTTPNIPTTTPNIPTTTPNIPTTTPNIPTTTPNIPTTPDIPTTITFTPTTTPNIPTTTPNVETTPSIETTTEQHMETTAIVTTPKLITTEQTPTTTTHFISTSEEIFTTDEANPSTPKATVMATSGTAIVATSKRVTTVELGKETTMNTPTTIKTTSGISENTILTTTEKTTTKASTCPSDTTVDDGFVLNWPESDPNTRVASLEKCANGSEQAGEPMGYRRCFLDSETGAHWLETELHCIYLMDINIQLAELAKLSITPAIVEEVAGDLAELTSESDDINSGGLKSTAEILEHIVNNATHASMEVTVDVLETVDNIFEVDEDEFREAEKANETVTAILLILETVVERIRENGTNLTYTGEHISVEVTQLPREAFDDGLTWSPDSEDEDHSGNKQYKKEPDATIHIPESVLDFIKDETIGVSFVIYENSALFRIPHPSKEQNGDDYREIRRQIGKVISATVSKTIIGLPKTDPVVTTFTISDRDTIEKDESLQCAYWDFAAAIGDGDWSTLGCELVSFEDKQAVCHCTHLTNFAIILDASGGTHNLVLELISKIGCAISIAALVITILSYLNIRNLRNKQPQRILLHLSVSLLGLYIVFLVGIEQTQWKHGCTVIAALMHYFTLTSISWMAVEAVNMYYVFVRVMKGQVHRFLLKASIFAWGVPLLIIAVIAGLDHTHYVNDLHCFLQPGIAFSLGVVFYIILVLLFNFVIFFMVMQRLTCGRKSKGTNKKMWRETWNRLQNAVTITVLLGLTWLFGFLTIVDSAVFYLQLLFCIFNSLQGLFIFLLFCVRPKEVRFAWRAWFSGSTIRRFSMSSYLSASRKRTSSGDTVRHRLNSDFNGMYRDRASRANLKLSLGEISQNSDNSVTNSLPIADNITDYKRFSTFKEELPSNEQENTETEAMTNIDETSTNEDNQVQNVNLQVELPKEEDDESASIDSGLPNVTIVEDHDGTETLIVTV